jgi:hypothetical protein
MASPSAILAALDPNSQMRLRLFRLKLLILFPCAILLALCFRVSVFLEIASCAFCYGFFTGAAALVRWEPVAGPSLNGWDELLAFLALKCLAQFLASILG